MRVLGRGKEQGREVLRVPAPGVVEGGVVYCCLLYWCVVKVGCSVLLPLILALV